MGFLDQSTNNIMLDAVLTDIGREFLARNDGSFNIVKFAFSDDEVDYSIIKKYGRTVGKEKIIKNTPILEALTNGDISQNHKLLSLSTPTLIRLPSFELVSVSSTTASATSDLGLTNVNMNIVDKRTASVVLRQTVGGASTVPVELIDQTYRVEVNNLFLNLGSGMRPVSVDTNNIATYLVGRDATLTTPTGGSKLSLGLNLKASLSSGLFSTFGTSSDKTVIRTYIQVTGRQSGAQANILCLINKTA
tara:strand:- start:1148 stop:1891 length:744 start_codon:yes stop_codon:yes gene_type:complete